MSNRNRRKHRRLKSGLRIAGRLARWGIRFVPMTPLERAALHSAIGGIGFMKVRRITTDNSSGELHIKETNPGTDVIKNEQVSAAFFSNVKSAGEDIRVTKPDVDTTGRGKEK